MRTEQRRMSEGWITIIDLMRIIGTYFFQIHPGGSEESSGEEKKVANTG